MPPTPYACKILHIPQKEVSVMNASPFVSFANWIVILDWP